MGLRMRSNSCIAAPSRFLPTAQPLVEQVDIGSECCAALSPRTVRCALCRVVSRYWWKKQKASLSSEFAERQLALAGRRVKEDDAYGKG
jgi:hypothetical protein